MLRTLFEVAETQGGARLASAASLVYTLGVVFIAWRALAPLIGGVLEAAAAGSGLHRGYTVVCNVCQARTLVGATCEKCNTALGISVPVRIWARLSGPGRLRRGRVSFGVGVLATVVFVIVTAFASVSLHALSPHGTLETLFIGVAAIAWAGAAFLLSRTFSLSGIGPLTRARELLFGTGALGVAVCAALLSQLARPVESKAVATLRAETDTVVIDGQKLTTASSELGFAYQVIESPALGTTLSVPLSFNGTPGSVILLSHDALEAWVLDATWQRAEALNGRGFAVKRRTETFKVTPGERYEVRMGPDAPTIQRLPTPVVNPPP